MDIKKKQFINVLIANLFLLITILYIYRTYIFRIEEFEIISDHIIQHVPFYDEFYRLLEKGNIAWSWNNFLGTNFYGSKGYYMIGDIFAYLSYPIFKLSGSTVYSLFCITLIKQIVGFNGFYLFLRKKNINTYISSIFSLLFVYSGWGGAFLEHPIFQTFYVFIPFILLGIEKIIRDKNSVVFIISCALMISANFYLAWSFCFFLLLYWIIRYVEENDKFIFKAYLKESFKILGYFLISVLLSAIVWLPTFYHMSLSPRISGLENINGGTLWNSGEIIQIISNFIVPVTRYENALYRGNEYYFYQIGIYCGLLPIISSFIYCINEKKDKNYKTNLALLAISLLTLISPKLGLLFHFTYSLRYSYFVMLALLIVGAYGLETIYKEDHKYKLVSIIIVLIIASVILILAYVIPKINGLDLLEYPEIKLYIKAIIFLFMYLLTLLFINNRKIMLGVLLVLGSLEISVQYKAQVRSMIGTSEISKVDYEAYYDQTTYLLVDYLKEYDDSFYRVYFDYGPYNFSMSYNIPTSSTYDSTYEYQVKDFLDLIRVDTNDKWDFNLNDPTIFELLDIKYVISNKKSDIFEYYGTQIYDDGMNHYIYLINDNNYLLRTYNDFIEYDKLVEVSKDTGRYLFEVIDTLKTKAVVKGANVDYLIDKYSNSEQLYLDPNIIENNYINFVFETKTDVFINLSIPNDKGWKIYDNGKEISIIDTNGGYIGTQLASGKHNLELKYEVPYRKTGIELSLVGILLFTIIQIKNKKIS